MNVYRFRQELQKLPSFAPRGEFDAVVNRAGVPAWRAAFTSVALMRHVAGYRLPDLDLFIRCYTRNFKEFERFRETKPEKYELVMTAGGQPTPGFLRRLSIWYETGITEMYVYVVLVQVIEDELKRGLVVYDARVDWKEKCDALILSGGRAFRIDTHFDPGQTRDVIVKRREEAEYLAKANTSVSAHWGNAELNALQQFSVVRSAADHEEFNGFRLFSRASLDGLLTQVYDALEVDAANRVSMDKLLTTRPGQ